MTRQGGPGSSNVCIFENKCVFNNTQSRFAPVVLVEVLGPSRLATPDSLPSYFCNSVSNTQGEFEAGNSPWGYSSALLVIFR